MNDYTIYCTEEQTKKALELSAPIDFFEENDENNEHAIHVGQGLYAIIPTAEQMIGWLESKGLNFEGDSYYMILETKGGNEIGVYSGIRKEATLAAIDAALDYLSIKKE